MIVLVPATVCDELREPVRDALPDVRLVPFAEDEAQPVPGAGEAEAVFRWIAGKRYADLVANGPRVRWLHTASAGVDHVLTPPVRQAVAERGVVVTDSGAAFEIAIAEFVLAWMLMVSRRLPTLLEMQRARHWEWLTAGRVVWADGRASLALARLGGAWRRVPKRSECERWVCDARPNRSLGWTRCLSGATDWTDYLPKATGLCWPPRLRGRHGA
jgi:phosphoglycerate dehydrogenase-like enzyme